MKLYFLDFNDEATRLILRLLNDGSLLFSITEPDREEYSEIDLFEAKGFGKVQDFMKLIIPKEQGVEVSDTTKNIDL